MRASKVPLIVFGVCCFGLVMEVLGSISMLPERVATHFGAGGAADGWMSRSGYAVFITLIGIGAASMSAAIFVLVGRLPVEWINLPRRDYWLAPERRAETLAWLQSHGMWMATGLVVFFAALHGLTVAANARQPPQLDERASGWLVAALMVGVGLWTVRLILRFARAPASHSTATLTDSAGPRSPRR